MSEVVVLGGGMVGVGTALALQAKGHAVTLVDRRGPGEETSFGNAGIIQTEAAEPYAIPQDLKTLLAYALGRSNDVTYSWSALPSIAPDLFAYFRCSSRQRHHAIARTYSQLTRRAAEDHEPYIEAAGLGNLIKKDGFYQLYRDPLALEKAAREATRLKSEYGVPSRILDSADLAREEPGLKKAVPGAVHWTGSWSCSDPGALTAGYAAHFVALGGRIAMADATTLQQASNGWELRSCSGEKISGEHVVVALGPWAPDFLKNFGYRVRMVYKRGYHGHFKGAGPLNRPLMDTANAVVMSPMTKGLRMTSGAALVDRNAVGEPTQLARAVAGVSDLVELGTQLDEPAWFGHRPCLPDMLPLVGKAPRHEGLWFNFGHGHQGFTLGPTTGQLLAEMMEGCLNGVGQALDPANRPLVLS